MSTINPCNRLNSPRRLLHWVSTFQLKTDTLWLLQIARHLDRSAYDLSVACFYDAGPVQDRLDSLGVRTFNLDAPHEADPRALLRAKRLIDTLQPDIVHTHLLRADLLAGAAARWAGVPVILSTVYAVGQFRRARKRRTDRLLDVACAALPTHLLAVSHAVKQDLIQRLGIHPRDITVIHTGVEPLPPIDPRRAVELRQRWNVGPDQPLVLTLARLSYEKGIDTLIDAAAIVHQSRPDARFVVVGNGPDQPQLEARAQSRGLKAIVQLVGFIDDVWPVIAAADLVCIPSKSEGMPNALLEAMAATKPIVATRVGGIPEAIDHNVNGLLVEPGQPRLLADALLRLLNAPSLALRLARSAQLTAHDKFHVKDVVARYESLYGSLLANRKGNHVHAHGD